MSLVGRLKDSWFRVIYRIQSSRRLSQGITSGHSIPTYVCCRCLRWQGSSGRAFNQCGNYKLVAHRGDTCKRFVRKV